MISVIIPTYNRSNCIKRSVDSVLNQTYKDFELIIVDDNSNDNTEEIINLINDLRVRYYKLDTNKGACYARNFGIDKAKGDYIAFQDSDDIWYPDKLKMQIEILKTHKEYGMVFCSMERNYGKNNTIPDRKTKNTSGKIFHSLAKKNFIGTVAILCKKQILIDMGGFDESFPALQDWDLSLRIASDYQIFHLKEILVRAELSEDSISRNWANVLQAMELLLEKHTRKLSTSEKKNWYIGMALKAFKANNKEKSFDYFKKSMDIYSIQGILSIYLYLKIKLNIMR